MSGDRDPEPAHATESDIPPTRIASIGHQLLVQVGVRVIVSTSRINCTALAKKRWLGRLCELATVLGASSRNLADILLPNAVERW